jgi:ketosteroid isomerase-like protein
MSRTPESTESVVRRHWAAYCRGDVPALMADYAEDAVLITPLTGVVRGRAGIEAVLQSVFSSAFPPASSRFALEGELIDGEMALLRWSVETPQLRTRGATDTIVVRDGRIVGQTGSLEIEPIGAASALPPATTP